MQQTKGGHLFGDADPVMIYLSVKSNVIPLIQNRNDHAEARRILYVRYETLKDEGCLNKLFKVELRFK